MQDSPRPSRRDAIKVVAAIAVVVLASPLRDVWAQPAWPWWTPFLVWLLVIVGALWATWGADGD